MKEKIVAYSKHYARQFGPAVLIFMFTVMISIALWSFRPDDLSFFYHATRGRCDNALGYFGATIAACLVYLFGTPAFLLPALMMASMPFVLRRSVVMDELDRIVGTLFSFFLLSGLCRLYKIGFWQFSGSGGVMGSLCLRALASFDPSAQAIILWTLFFVSTVLMARFAHVRVARMMLAGLAQLWVYCIQVEHAPARMVRLVARAIAAICFGFAAWIRFAYHLMMGATVHEQGQSIVHFESDGQKEDKDIDVILQDLFGQQDIEIIESKMKTDFELVPEKSFTSQGAQVPAHEAHASESAQASYELPDIEKMLVYGNYSQQHHVDQKELAQYSAILEEKLKLFGVQGKVVHIHPGPVITLFEYRPENHIKLSKIIGLEDDLAMALQAMSIRILAPIPGKDVVGFEVANKVRTPVLLSDIFHAAAWTKFKGSLPLILGEDTHGNHIVVDLATMPHLLIAGSTGSGKSVALNCMLVSLLCAKKPEDLKLVIIDPKQIEFNAYEHIAHLLFPVITDSRKAVPVLKWVVMTMEERYERMAEVGVKNIFEYQKHQASSDEAMPFIVVIIDELADLMMTTGKDAEDLIARIAQMSRAAGIHMIVATQRPSVDVITGLIKVNFPNRISFKVTSKVDSRTILDEMGAERLLGKGDMLFIDSKEPHMRRVHGAYVSEKEIVYLVGHIQQQQKPEYLDITEFFTQEGDSANSALYENDQALYQQVVDLIAGFDEISISMIQRHFRIGYNRSARIIDTLQARGLILPSDGGKMRRVVKSNQ